MNEPQTYVDLQDAGNAQAQLILQAIARHADWNTGQCYPSQDAIAKMAKCSVRTVRSYLAKLESDGFIDRETRRKDNGAVQSDLITLIGYQEWITALREGGKVAKPKETSRYEQPAKLAGGEAENLAGPPGKLLAGPPGKQVAANSEPSLNNHGTKSAQAREDFKSGFGSEVVTVTRAQNPQALIAWEKYADKRQDDHHWRTVKRLIRDHGFFQAPSLYPPDFAPNMRDAAE